MSSLESFGVSQNLLESFESFQNLLEYFMYPLDFFRIVWSAQDLSSLNPFGILQILWNCFGILWNSLKLFRTLWNPLESFGVLIVFQALIKTSFYLSRKQSSFHFNSTAAETLVFQVLLLGFCHILSTFHKPFEMR